MQLSAPTTTGLADRIVRSTGLPAYTPTDGRLFQQDRAFLVAAHQTNLAEIAGGYVALAKVDDPEVRRMARRLVVDHRRLDAKVRAVAFRYAVRLPDRSSAWQEHQLGVVARLSGPVFDRAWLKLQEAGHLVRLAAIHRELAAGHAACMKVLARATAGVVKEHLSMVREALAHHSSDDPRSPVTAVRR